MLYRYLCIRSRQTAKDKWLAQFAAPAPAIDAWAGVPQKKRFEVDGDRVGETVGFQREESAQRIKSLRDFYRNSENIIQNPILCSLRDAAQASVEFTPFAETSPSAAVQLGELVIEAPDFSTFSIEKCIQLVREYLEHRVPDLKDRKPDPALVRDLKARAADSGYLQEAGPAEHSETEGNDAADSETTDNGAPTGVLFEESHIVDFWQDIAARHELVKELDRPIDTDNLLGFAKDALLSYLRPVVLVDGQHRLQGALAAARERLNDSVVQSEIENQIAEGKASRDVEAEITLREARWLPVSLLMSTDPEEQVFQFVVVNQKAMPIGRALLGTIVSTTLSNDEMGKVAIRLKDAGIQVEESQAITYLARHPASPFYNKIERGMAGDAKNVLQWNVFASLVNIFRHLKGGRLFGQRNDYADLWKDKFLPLSKIVADYENHGCESQAAYWSELDGPWRGVFIAFWTEVCDAFGNIEDPDKHNYWGRPRDSNLFNKISLTILAADFFQFLVETRTQLGATDEVPDLVHSWLENVNQGYFDKDWALTGVKKDSVGIRNQWASLWSEYRKSGGNLPDRRLFRQAKGLQMASGSVADEAHFLTSAFGALDPTWNIWHRQFLERLARLQVPGQLLGSQRTLLRADIREQWARWFVESLADPRCYARERAHYPRIFEDVYGAVQTRFPHFNKPEQMSLASVAARTVLDFVLRLQESQGRQSVSLRERLRLLDFTGNTPRCWICGAAFSEGAVDNFRGRGDGRMSPPLYLDVLKPRGLFSRDLRIEVDHIVSRSHGGSDEVENLALACGWCNRHKSSYSSIYDVEGRPRTPRSSSVRANSLPQPFWTVRLLATVRNCQHPDGCTYSADNSAVTVAPVCENGAMNPMNLSVTCYEHDPYKLFRYQPYRDVREVWNL